MFRSGFPSESCSWLWPQWEASRNSSSSMFHCSAAAVGKGCSTSTVSDTCSAETAAVRKYKCLKPIRSTKNVVFWTRKIAYTWIEIWRGRKETDGYRTGTDLSGIDDTLWLCGRGISALCSELRKARTHFGCSTALGKCPSQWISSFSAVGKRFLIFHQNPWKVLFPQRRIWKTQRSSWLPWGKKAVSHLLSLLPSWFTRIIHFSLF